MKFHTFSILLGSALAFAALGAIVGWLGSGFFAPRQTASANTLPGESGETSVTLSIPALQSPTDKLVTMYSAKFSCLEPLQPGTQYYGVVAPLSKLATNVLIHNPNAFPVTIYKKAVIAPFESGPEVAPGNWQALTIKADYARRDDCDEITKLLTGNPAATFLSTYGIGVRVEGYLVIGIGPQTVASVVRAAPLEVTAQYERTSEFLKKDMNYQPWWTWWWWPLPWRLGYAYNRVLPVSTTSNIDCRGTLYSALNNDTLAMPDATQRTMTSNALGVGQTFDPTNLPPAAAQNPALVALIGQCNKIVQPNGSFVADITYVLVSNKSCTDPDPRNGQVCATAAATYPWWPGRWYDLPVVMPQNTASDLDDYIRKWHSQRWIDAGASAGSVSAAMVYYFPFWCGWGYWWGWNDSKCTNIAVGNGDSVDVVQVIPDRVFVPSWPPPPSGFAPGR